MACKKRVLAFDFGASSGRAMIGIYDGKTIQLEEVHRFSNDPVMMNGTMYWDILRLFYEIKQGITKAQLSGGFDSIGIDTWGVDFGLIDKAGNLLENPVHYRDARTAGMVEKSFSVLPKEQFYQLTGIQFMEINTVFQLYSLALNRPELLERAETLLLTPDLFNFMLTGTRSTEYSIASTTQMLDAKRRAWSPEVLKALQIPERLLTKIVPPGTPVGKLSAEICEELGVPAVDVISVASHDTQSAVAAVPAEEEDFIFISCGTWSLFGTELAEPVIDESSYDCNLTNEGGCGYRTTFLKNIIGLWMIQESRRQWRREGKEYSYADLERFAVASEPFQYFIDPDAPAFVPQGNIPRRVREFCERSGQKIPQTEGEVMRCIYESLALKYRYAFEQIKRCTGKTYHTIHMVGGGTKDRLLCQMTADCCGCRVVAGPVEATVLGNVAVQLMASGEINSLEEARRIVADSQDKLEYFPQDTARWDEAYQKFQSFITEK